MRAIQLEATGGPEVLQPTELEIPEPGPGQARVRIAAAGLNFIDTYHRSGAYGLELPAVVGLEAAGVVDAVGPPGDDADETGTQGGKPEVGDRVAYCGERGAYAEFAVVPTQRLVPVPEELELETAAAVMLQGMTAHYLSHDTYPLGPGDTALVLAAAGGVGHLLVQLAAARGAEVIGVVSTQQKAELAAAYGAAHVIRYTRQEVAATVRELTGGRGVEVVYDSVGRATFDDSLDCAATRGTVVLFGQSSGAVSPLDPQTLNSKGSLFLTRPSLFHYVATRAALLQRAADVLGAVASGWLEVRIDRRMPLEQAAGAHRYIEGRNTRGKVLLVP